MRESVSIERLGAGDIERLRSIRLRALKDAPHAYQTTFAEADAYAIERWEEQLRRLATFVAREGDRDVGLARGAPHEHLADAGWLLSMWVAPEARGCGIGEALIDAVVGWARDEGLRRLFLEVGGDNSPAAALYARKGFVPGGGSDAGPSPGERACEIQLVMRL